jgi:Radical SAM superfamily
MRWIAQEYDIHNFSLVHDMFTVDRRRVADFCQAMIAAGENFTWSCSARTDCVDRELLEMMARGGCRGIFYGVEVGSARMQKIIDKDLDLERAKQVIDDTEELGIRSTVSLITGFPEETWEDLRQTVRIYMHSARWPGSSPQLNLLAPLAETPIHAKHRERLVLDELCSDMSHQGSRQNQADLRLIRQHPDIFPNFYLLPLEHLDRNSLLELREFMLNALARFRWLIVAIDQRTHGIGDFFFEWREYRLILRPGLEGLDLRRYYHTLGFCDDFRCFVRQHPIAGHTAVKTLLEFENAVRDSILRESSVKPLGSLIPPGSELWWSDIPVKKAGTTMIEFPRDIQVLIQNLRRGSGFTSSPARHFYLSSEVSPGNHKIEEISDWIAGVLRSSDGRRDIQEVVEQLDRDVTEFEESVRDYAFVQLLRRAHAEGFIEIYRPSSNDS